jgi:hypothetical protein
MKSKSKVKSKPKKSSYYEYYEEPKPAPKKKTTYSKLADEFKPKPKQEEPKEKVIDHCLCCEANCQCCEHPVAITTHFCKCPCHV